MILTEHFKLAEFTRSATASRLGIDNTPPESVVNNLKNLCVQVLEPLRQWYGKPIVIGSGFRCKQLNSAVGGVWNSQHMTGEAADLHLPNNEIGRAWFRYIRDNLPYDQLIMEKNTKSSKNFWIHVSCKQDLSKNRKQKIDYLVKYK